MKNDFSLKELYDVSLKTTYPIEVSGRKIEIGETIAIFDRIQIALLDEIKSVTAARGGAGNQARVWWEDTKEMKISFSQGVFSLEHFALMSNAKLIAPEESISIPVSRREIVETNDEGWAETKYPIAAPVFVYNKKTGEKYTTFNFENNRLHVDDIYTDLIIDYQYNYQDGGTILTCGQPLTTGYLTLEGKTRVKDDITGQITTGIIKIPKLKLLSKLSMRLGSDAIPQVGRLDAVAVPTGVRGQQKVMELVFLHDDIDSDI